MPSRVHFKLAKLQRVQETEYIRLNPLHTLLKPSAVKRVSPRFDQLRLRFYAHHPLRAQSQTRLSHATGVAGQVENDLISQQILIAREDGFAEPVESIAVDVTTAPAVGQVPVVELEDHKTSVS